MNPDESTSRSRSGAAVSYMIQDETGGPSPEILREESCHDCGQMGCF